MDRIFLSLKSQFTDFEYEKKEFAFVRTEQQIDKIIKECSKQKSVIILYTIVETKLAKYMSNISDKINVPCFGILGNLILNFSKLLNQKAIHKPSAQHVLDDDYYKRIEAIQFTMSHDDGKKTEDISNSDVILLELISDNQALVKLNGKKLVVGTNKSNSYILKNEYRLLEEDGKLII